MSNEELIEDYFIIKGINIFLENPDKACLERQILTKEYITNNNRIKYMSKYLVSGLIYHNKHYKNTYTLPIAYTVDIGIQGKHLDYKPFLIEFNDMWAIGPYGCKEEDYFSMLKDRWNEIIR